MLNLRDNWYAISIEHDINSSAIVYYRYLVTKKLKNINNEYKSVVSRWEAHKSPRAFDFEQGLCTSDFFGSQCKVHFCHKLKIT